MPDRYSTTRTPLSRRATSLALVLVTACSPTLAGAAQPTIPGFYGKVPMPGAPVSGTLPVVRPGSTPVGATLGSVGNTLTVNQSQAQVTIDWSSFDIAPDSVVIFNQKQNGVAQPQWTALNRIHDANNPSLIFGKIQADGKVYLINRNGILFGPGSQVNVHSLVASNLNLTDANFQNGKLRFTTAAAAGQEALSNDAYVSNYGSIATDSGGSVFLLGPNVVNAGTISSPSGKINLIGVQGDGEVKIKEITADSTANDVTYSDLQAAGAVYNAETGRLITEAGGRIGMYGATVQHDGLIRSVTALKKGGVVYLSARDKVTTGVASVIETPIEAATETATPTLLYDPGVVTLGGLYTETGKENDLLNTLNLVEHRGAIVAPSGQVTLTAKDRILLDDTSSIDVSGLWLDRAASANLIDVQLNSVYLRDDYGQKSGILLGQKAKVDLLTGSNIGDLSSYYEGLETSAEQRSTEGGSILFGDTKLGEFGVALGELVMENGARLDFSGGGTRYSAGVLAASRLVSGNKVYDMASAPQWVQYDRLADSQERTHKRFGVTEKFSGLYFGGGSSVHDLTAARTVGSDAGSVTFKARVMTLDGTLTGKATAGQYQTGVHDKSTSAHLISAARGIETPDGGTVVIGEAYGADISSLAEHKQDAITESIVLTASGVGDGLDPGSSTISAEMLNLAGLSHLELYANTTLKIADDAEISLLPGGTLTARGRRIEHYGAIDVAGGSVEMTTRPNVTSHEIIAPNANPLYREVTELVYLGQGSRISVAGERIDNSAPGLSLHGTLGTGHTAGGSISIQERSEYGTSDRLGSTDEGRSLILASGALLDVSGGWSIDGKGKISGASAGTLELKGSTLSLAGEMRGHSIPGAAGGEIKLHAGEVLVTSHDLVLPDNRPLDGAIPEYLLGKLVLSENRLKDTGFTRIALSAIEDITFSKGAVLAPSLAKAEMPVPALVSQSRGTGNLVVPDLSNGAIGDYLGAASVSLVAGQNIYTGPPALGLAAGGLESVRASVVLESGTAVRVTPGGKVSLSAPKVEIAGTIEAPGGTVNIKATELELVLKSGGEILASGYNKDLTSTVAGLPAGYDPKAGGTVSLISSTSIGGIRLEAGSVVDVSGSVPTQRLVAGADGVPVPVTVAGDPGQLNLTYMNSLTMEGEISGEGRLEGVRGATLQVVKSAGDLRIGAGEVERFVDSGFDALTFVSSFGSILLPVQLDVSLGRTLTLDAAKRIEGAEGGEVKFSAPSITLTNSGIIRANAPGAPDAGTGSITLAGGFVDVKGSTLLSGFRDVTLQADHDISFADRVYGTGTAAALRGEFGVTGNLTLQAARIYPTSMSDFTVTSKGKISIPPGESPDYGAVYSAGGKLTIDAAGGIEHAGNLAAPMGSITLSSEQGRVYLAPESRISTTGTGAIPYGSYDGSTWSARDMVDIEGAVVKGPEVTGAPTNSITLSGREVVVREGATQDVSGGGSIYATLFQSGIPGSVDPRTKGGRFVILPGNDVKLPGAAVYLDAVPEFGLAAGVYTVLSGENAKAYAHLPGALVVEKTKLNLPAGEKALSQEGYLVVAGYDTVADTSIASSLRSGYLIRSATEVLEEGDITVKDFKAENGGDFTLRATGGASYAGTLADRPLTGFSGGVLSLSARDILVREGSEGHDAGVDFATALPDETLQLAASWFNEGGYRELRLGDQGITETVTVQSGAELKAPSLTLSAKDAVTVEGGAQVLATGGDGSGIASVATPSGTLTLEDGGVLHATNGLRLDVADAVINGEMAADNSSMSLTADKIIFAANGTTQLPGALYLTDDPDGKWGWLGLYSDLTLASRSDMEFLHDVDLVASGSLTLDAAGYVGSAGADVSLAATTRLMLLNSGATSPRTALSGDATASLTLSGAEIVVAPRLAGNKGNIVFDKFGTVALKSKGDLTLKGAGAVRTGGNLALTAARVTTSYYSQDADPTKAGDTAIPYTAAAIRLDAGNGHVSIVGNGNEAENSRTPGGSLEIVGGSITVGDTNVDPQKRKATVVEVASGQLKLSATGDIVVTDRTSLLAGGTATELPMQDAVYSYTPAGLISLKSGTGKIDLAQGSTLDVSAAAKGDAGTVALSAATGGITLSGTITGKPSDGNGGSFTIDSAALSGSTGLDALSKTLSDGGFNERIYLRSRAGNVALSSGKTISGKEVVIAADGGALDISGNIKADGTKTGEAGGRVELYAGTSLTLSTGSTISAKGVAGADGGTVSLSSLASDKVAGEYALSVDPDAVINVSGGTGGIDGTVSMRAYRIGGNDVNMAALAAKSVVGASTVSVEAARRYDNVTAVGAATQYLEDAADFLENSDTVKNRDTMKTRLFGSADSANRLQAGIEIVSADGANLAFNTAWDLSALRPGGEAGVLTLRSGKDLTISANLVDHGTHGGANGYLTLHSTDMRESWGINLVAGAADAKGANYKGAEAAKGNMTFGPNGVVYTEYAPISFAAGNDVIMNAPAAAPGYMINKAMKYNLGGYGGEIRGQVGNSLELDASGSAIQTALGDIDIRIGRDLELGGNAITSGAIRTTGEYRKYHADGKPLQVESMPGRGDSVTTSVSSYWTYQNGGSIVLDVVGSVNGNLSKDNGWDGAFVDPSVTGTTKALYPWYLTAGFGDGKAGGENTNNRVTVGVATMGGGDLSVRSGGSLLTQVGTFGRGDLEVVSGADMTGRFRAMDGSMTLVSGGGFGKEDAANPTYRSVLELALAQADVAAQGDVHIGAVLNPDNSRDGVFVNSNALKWNLTYDPDTSATVTSLGGDTTLYGSNQFLGYSSVEPRGRILPATLSLGAAGDLNIRQKFYLAPSEKGNLSLFAGGDVSGTGPNGPNSFIMNDVDAIGDFYGRRTGEGYESQLTSLPKDLQNVHSQINHKNDTVPVTVVAGDDIDTIRLVLNKQAHISAADDIRRLDLVGQNNSAESVTMVSAGGSIEQGMTINGAKVAMSGGPSYGTPYPEIVIGGPGTLLVQARESINLGNSRGIQSIGNLMNRAFTGDQTDSDIIVSVGAKDPLTPGEARKVADALFTPSTPGGAGLLDEKGERYTKLKADGKDDEAQQQLEAARAEIAKYFDAPPKVGDTGSITMFDSEISSGKADISIMTRNELNVGRTALQDPTKAQANTGINTTFGGGINIYSGGDINVNESRVMTFMGGNMVLWSDLGDINAGRGSKTTVSSSGTNEYKYDENGNIVSIILKVPAVGSGLRALTYDPDGSSGPLNAPEPGDIHAYAPTGTIFAGEAGIAGGNVVLGADIVDDTYGTIAATNGLVGPASESSISLGALTGASNLTDTDDAAEQASGLGTGKEKNLKEKSAVEEFFSKWLDLRILSFDSDAEADSEKDTKEEQDKEKRKN